MTSLQSEGCPLDAFGRSNLFEDSLSPCVFLVVGEGLLVVELEGVLDAFDGGAGTGLFGAAVLLDGYIVFGPVDEILPKAGVL